MFSQYLNSIEGVEIFPIISLILFFAFFIGMLFWVLRMDKKYITEMENLPLDSTDSLIKNSEIKNDNK